MTDVAGRVAAVIVDYHADELLARCVDSLVANGVANIVVVENGEPGSTPPALAQRPITLVVPGLNLGYGRGVNRGAAATDHVEFLLVSNPDVVVHDGAVAALVTALDATPAAAVAGPRILRPDGTVYPSHRVFPNMWLAGAHALLAPLWPGNPATKRYRARHADGTVDWVSGACFLIRRSVFEAIGGFDERYFMFAEDMALCLAVQRAGHTCLGVESAEVTHVEGVSRRRAPRAMVLAHHASALRFEWQSASGWRRALVPVAALVLGVRLLVVLTFGSRG